MKSGFLLIIAMIAWIGTAAAATPSYQWHTFYGSSESDAVQGTAVDSSGNVYVTGHSSASWNGPAGQEPLNAFASGGTLNIFVLKLSSAGTYQWHTFYGAGNNDAAHGLAVDQNGDVVILGDSPSAWNGPAGQTPLHAWNSAPGCVNLFVLKLSGSGAYQWHTFHGPPGAGEYCTGNIFPRGITTDGSGNVYITGDEAGSNWFGPQGQPPLNPFNGDYTYNLFVLKLTGSGTYLWHTFHGYHNNGGDTTNSIAVDGSGALLITGTSTTPWTGPGVCTTPGTPPCPIDAFGSSGDPYGSTNIFVLKLTGSGGYQWHTFHGASGWSGTSAFGIAPDTGGSVYVTGSSSNSWNGPGTCTISGVSPCPLNEYTGYADIFVLKLTGSGAYQWHTFYGGEGVPIYGSGIAVNAGGVYVTGPSWATWNGPGNTSPVNDAGSIVILKLNGDGAYQWHSFYGSTSDLVNGLAIQGGTDIYVTGTSEYSWNGPANAAPLHDPGGGWSNYEVYVLKLYDPLISRPVVSTAPVAGMTTNTASGGGTVANDGGLTVTSRGVCWSVNADPTTAGSHTSDGSGTGAFISAITGLSPYTTYFARAYATNAMGTAYGDNVYFTTLCPSDVARIGVVGYSTLQSAIDSIIGSADVRAVAGVCTGGLTIDGNKIVKLTGGYDCVCNTHIGLTSLRGKLTIKQPAQVAVSNLAIY